MIQIKNPCDANWQEMTPAQSGKYCGACEKVVVDFSNMKDAEIKKYFATYKEQKTCGRFLDSQLDRPLVVPPQTRFAVFLDRLNQIPVARAVVFFLTSTSMWISSCIRNTDEDHRTTGDTTAVIENLNTESTNDTTVAVKSKRQEEKLIKPDNVVMGEVPGPPTVGIVCISPDEPDTVAVTFPATSPDTNDFTLHMIKGKVMMTDTITQKIKRKKK